MSYLINRVINRFLKRFMISRIETTDKVVYLTFDDGPELEITEFVLGELDKYGFKATFFCRGDNAEKNPQLLRVLRDKGHAIANHTYSHTPSYTVSGKWYADDVHKADSILHSKMFRPDHGSIKLSAWLRLRKDFTFYLWSRGSGDSDLEEFNLEENFTRLTNNTQPGDITLFHFCHRHEKETRQILPLYLKWLKENGYRAEIIPNPNK